MATSEGRLSAQLLRTLGVGAKASRMGTRDADFLAQLPLAEITKVTFYKRDEITTDLICCEVVVDGVAWTFHEELVNWDSLVEHLEKLPNFRADWLAAVSRPPFVASETIAFSRD